MSIFHNVEWIQFQVWILRLSLIQSALSEKKICVETFFRKREREKKREKKREKSRLRKTDEKKNKDKKIENK